MEDAKRTGYEMYPCVSYCVPMTVSWTWQWAFGFHIMTVVWIGPCHLLKRILLSQSD